LGNEYSRTVSDGSVMFAELAIPVYQSRFLRAERPDGCMAMSTKRVKEIVERSRRCRRDDSSPQAIDVINVYNVYKKNLIFVNAFIILSTFISIKIT